MFTQLYYFALLVVMVHGFHKLNAIRMIYCNACIFTRYRNIVDVRMNNDILYTHQST